MLASFNHNYYSLRGNQSGTHVRAKIYITIKIHHVAVHASQKENAVHPYMASKIDGHQIKHAMLLTIGGPIRTDTDMFQIRVMALTDNSEYIFSLKVKTHGD